MKIAVLTGSFDPITIGHIDIITRASKLVDKLYVVGFINENKNYYFTNKQRLDMLKIATKDIKNVECDISLGYACDYCIKVGASFMIRGIRNNVDYEYEKDLAIQNIEYKGIDTLFLLANNEVSSNDIRKKLENKQNIDNLVTKEIKDYILGVQNERSR